MMNFNDNYKTEGLDFREFWRLVASYFWLNNAPRILPYGML